MRNEILNFEELANRVLKEFETSYALEKHSSSTRILFSNKYISIDIYFENYFEINIYLKFLEINKNQDINFILLTKCLNLDKDIMSMVSSNQIIDNKYLIKYLECARNILIIIINLHNNERDLLCGYLKKYNKYVFEVSKQKQLQEFFSILNNLWNEKKYAEYLMFFEKNNNLIMNSEKYSLARHRALYIKKHFPKQSN